MLSFTNSKHCFGQTFLSVSQTGILFFSLRTELNNASQSECFDFLLLPFYVGRNKTLNFICFKIHGGLIDLRWHFKTFTPNDRLPICKSFRVLFNSEVSLSASSWWEVNVGVAAKNASGRWELDHAGRSLFMQSPTGNDSLWISIRSTLALATPANAFRPICRLLSKSVYLTKDHILCGKLITGQRLNRNVGQKQTEGVAIKNR